MGDFIELYMQYAGQTEVPPQFHKWCALSLIAAAVGDRVWVTRAGHRDNPIFPNLYVLLLSESGSGKGEAIKAACRLVRDNPTMLSDTYYGKVSGQGLSDWMSGRTVKPIVVSRNGNGVHHSKPCPHPVAYVVNEELALDIGRGHQADDFIKFLTGLYGGSMLPWRDLTRTLVNSGGGVSLPKAVINWLAGSTQAWCLASVSRDAIEGGFFARLVTVEGTDQPRQFEARFPPDYDELVLLLGRLINSLQTLEGEAAVSPYATAILRQWYMTRPDVDDPVNKPAWNRDLVLVYKISLVLALSEWAVVHALWEDKNAPGEQPSLLIADRHVIEAERLIRTVHRAVPRLSATASGGDWQRKVDKTRGLIQKHKRLDHSELLRRSGGIPAKEIRTIIDELMEANLVSAEIFQHPTVPSAQKKTYVWLGDGKFTHITRPPTT